jgi:hypothetical protein
MDRADAAPPPGPYHTNWGPIDGPIPGSQGPPALGVSVPDVMMPVGIAYPVALVRHRNGPATTFRLVVRDVELPGFWLCVGREFVPLGEAAEWL